MKNINIDLLSVMGIYIQKSRTFLWPLLNIKVQPLQTYLYFDDITLENFDGLIALFYREDAQYSKFKSEIEQNPKYDNTFQDGDYDIVLFNMHNIKTDYDCIIAGKYSKLSNNFKMIISVIENNKSVLMCLEPENNYKTFANALGVIESELEDRELLSPPDKNKETLCVSATTKALIAEEYALV